MAVLAQVTNQGFSAFMAFGLNWPGSAPGREPAGHGSPSNVIDIPARSAQPRTQERSTKARRSALVRQEPLTPLTYGPPERRGRAPRLKHAPRLTGRLIDTVA